MKEKIVLHIGGEEMTFDEKELAMAVEYYFANEFGTSPISEIPGYRKPMLRETSPTVGRWFLVNPMCINRSLFMEEKEDKSQECIRKLILGAFNEVDGNKLRYQNPFETLIPLDAQIKPFHWLATEEMTIAWFDGLIRDSDKFCSWANRIEQCLEWAQRIQNGEPWEDLCNKAD